MRSETYDSRSGPKFRRDPLTGGLIVVAPGRALRPSDRSQGRGTGEDVCLLCGPEEQQRKEISAAVGCRDSPGLEVMALGESHGGLPGEGDPARLARRWDAIARRVKAVRGAGPGMEVLVASVWGRTPEGEPLHPVTRILWWPRRGSTIDPRRAERASPADRGPPADRPVVCPECRLAEAVGSERPGLAIFEDAGYRVLASWASRGSGGVRVVPVDHEWRLLEQEQDPRREGLSRVLARVHRGLAGVFPGAAFSEVFRLTPTERGLVFVPGHEALELAVRTARLAGFEHGTGVHISTLPAEELAGRLRDAL